VVNPFLNHVLAYLQVAVHICVHTTRSRVVTHVYNRNTMYVTCLLRCSPTQLYRRNWV